jgi:hypothetical protein
MQTACCYVWPDLDFEGGDKECIVRCAVSITASRARLSIPVLLLLEVADDVHDVEVCVRD